MIGKQPVRVLTFQQALRLLPGLDAKAGPPVGAIFVLTEQGRVQVKQVKPENQPQLWGERHLRLVREECP